MANPLRDVPRLDLGPAEPLLQTAGKQPAALLNVFLYTGQIDRALGQAKVLLRESSNKPSRYIAAALRQFARCFRAHDLSLQRANAFLQYHATGQGDNPLKALEQELTGRAAGAKP